LPWETASQQFGQHYLELALVFTLSVPFSGKLSIANEYSGNSETGEESNQTREPTCYGQMLPSLLRDSESVSRGTKLLAQFGRALMQFRALL
jgi:hypothetical protein